MNCRICNTTTKKFLDLGKQPMANNFIQSPTMDEFFYNLEVFFCPDCFTVQIGNCPAKEDVFNDDYAFFTSTSEYMKQHFKELAHDIKSKLPLNGSFVVEIGSNDGTFLKNFKRYNHLGIEPSGNVCLHAKKKGVICLHSFFNKETADRIVDLYGKADVIVSANVFPHMVDRKSVLDGIRTLLKPDGVWINEEASLSRVINLCSYDQFYNEHIFFSSVSSFKKTMKMFDLCLSGVCRVEVHGGTTRYFTTHAKAKNGEKHGMVEVIADGEVLDNFDVFAKFSERVKTSRKRFMHKLFSIGQKTVGYGATAKSTTVLNYCKVGTSLIDKIYDTTPIKIGKLSPGMHVPIAPYCEFERDKPENVVLFAWNHAEEIMEKEKGERINWILPI